MSGFNAKDGWIVDCGWLLPVGPVVNDNTTAAASAGRNPVIAQVMASARILRRNMTHLSANALTERNFISPALGSRANAYYSPLHMQEPCQLS